ncbi:MAG: flavodoxin family protein, partial [Planctomycetia bacterium]|nr:flavodoxin family protein [Planctomycetia bacterium]
IVRLNEMRLGYCQGCYACTKTGKCFQNDGMNELAEKVRQADVLVLATPVYFYTMSGQMKVFIDRLVPVYT